MTSFLIKLIMHLLQTLIFLLKAYNAGIKKGLDIKVGNVFTEDLFYNEFSDHEKLAQYGVLAVEMEASALYTLAAKFGRKALTILTVSDHILTGEATSSEERQLTFNDMIEVALEACNTKITVNRPHLLAVFFTYVKVMGKVGNGMDEKDKIGLEQENEPEIEPVLDSPAKRLIQLKPFSFVMLVFGLILITAGITFFILTVGDGKVVEVVKPPQQQTLERKEFKKLYEAYDEMISNYFQDIDETAVIDGAINGMIDALGDPYSDYLNEDEARQLNESISSSFEGIGAEIQEQDGYIAVVSPIKNSPAERAGLLPKDKIIAVDGESIQGMSSSEAVLLIRGEKGTPVTLTIMRGG